MTLRVTVSSVTPNGHKPQYYDDFIHNEDADKYIRERRAEAARAGVLIRCDKQEVITDAQ